MERKDFRKVNIIATIVLVAVFVLLLIYQSGAFNEDPKVDVVADNCYDKTLVVITDQDYSPYSFFDKDGKPSGHDVELMIKIANELHMNLELKLMPWDEGIAEITAGNADVLMTCDYSDSFEGVDKLIKSEPTSIDDFIVYSREKITSADQVYGKKIAIMKNGNVMSEINKMQLGKYCVEYNDNREAMQALVKGDVDFAIMRQTVGTVLLKELNAPSVKGYVSIGRSDMCFGINIDKPELVDEINSAIETLKMRGELEQLETKWLTTFIKPYSVEETIKNNIWTVFAFVVLISMMIAIFRTYNKAKEVAEKEEFQNAQVIEQLAQDFTCVNYIRLTDDPVKDNVTNYRVSEKLKELIPGWEKEKVFDNKMKLLRDNLVYEPDREEFYKNVQRPSVLEGIEEAGVHFVNARAVINDEIQYYQMKFSPIYEDGEITGVVAGLHSVDEETKNELAHQGQLQKALDVADTLHDIIHSGKWSFFVNANDEIFDADVSDAANSIINNDVAADGHSWLEIVHPDEREMAEEAFNATIKDHTCKTPYDVNYRMMDRDGTYHWFHSAGRIIRDENGNGEFFGIHVDITDQMEEQQKRLLGAMPLSNDVLAKANIGMWAFELDEGKPPRMYDDAVMLGLVGLDHQVSPEEAYHAWYDNIDEGSYDLVAEAVEKMMTEHAEVQYPWHYPDGRTIIVRCGGVRNFEYTKGIRIEGTHQDVTETLHFDEEEREREERERQAEIARIKAEASNKAKTEFLFNMSHDIRTPMNAIMGFTGMAEKHIDDKEKVLDCLTKTQKASNLLLSLINSVLDVNRIESGKAVLDESSADVMCSFSAVEDIMTEMAETKDIDLKFEFGEIKDRFVVCDLDRSNRIFTNIISNAIKYTNEGGHVNVRCDQVGEAKDGFVTYRYTFKDDGIGMSEEFQKHLFEQFSREASSTVSGIQGTGLGMAVVKSFVDLMNGTIECKSKLGEGTTIIVEIPFKLQEGEDYTDPLTRREEGPDAPKPKRMSFNGRRILLVEDNELNREITEEMLTEEKFVVESANDGTVAVELLKEKGPEYYDFILMDIQMPKMNGYDATRAIRAMYPDAKLPIVALSANAFSEDRVASKEAGMNGHIAKPISTLELLSTLAQLIDGGGNLI